MNKALHECERIIKHNMLTLAAAESCTGGLVSAELVSLAGSSAWFVEGAVTYTEDSKMHRLGVMQKTLQEHSAVSHETAQEMACGVKLTSGAQVGISTTGYAGPGGGTESDPVGTVYFGFSYGNVTCSTKMHFDGDRNEVRKSAAEFALAYLCENLLKNGLTTGE